MTLRLLWREYKDQHPDGLQYSQFCELYRQFAKDLDVTMRQVYRGGEKLFVDFAGDTVQVFDPKTGEVRRAQIFVAVLGASGYTFATAFWAQHPPCWIEGHIPAFEFFAGVPEIVVPDNLKAGVTKASYYESEVNPTYQELAEHYGTVIIPARPGKSTDKAKVERGVLLVEQQILARLRNRSFFHLHELRQAILELLPEINERPFQKLEASRRSLYEELDKPALKPLPPVVTPSPRGEGEGEHRLPHRGRLCILRRDDGTLPHHQAPRTAGSCGHPAAVHLPNPSPDREARIARHPPQIPRDGTPAIPWPPG